MIIPRMSMLERVKTALQGPEPTPVRSGLGLGLATDRIMVTEPRAGAVWTCGEPAAIGWAVTGAADYPVRLTLVRINGVLAEDVAVLAGGVDPALLSVTVTVPQVDPGADYAVFLSSADPAGVYSPTIRIRA